MWAHRAMPVGSVAKHASTRRRRAGAKTGLPAPAVIAAYGGSRNPGLLAGMHTVVTGLPTGRTVAALRDPAAGGTLWRTYGEFGASTLKYGRSCVSSIGVEFWCALPWVVVCAHFSNVCDNSCKVKVKLFTM